MWATWWRCGLGAALLAVLMGQGGLAEEKKSDDSLPPDLARISGKVAALQSVRVADLWSSPFGKSVRSRLDKGALGLLETIEKSTGLSPADVERVTLVLPTLRAAEPMIFFATTRDFDRAKVFKVAVPGGKEMKYAGATFTANERKAACALGERAFVIGDKGDIQTLLDSGKGKPEAPLTPALELAAKKHSLVAAVSSTALAQIEKDAPRGLGPFQPLLKANLITAVVDVGPKTIGRIRADFANEEEAKKGLGAVKAVRQFMEKGLAGSAKELSDDKSAEGLVKILELAVSSLKSARITQDNTSVKTTLEMKLDEKVAGAAVLDAVQRIRRAAARAQSINNLKQIALAMHNYLSTNGTFPPQAIYDKDGKALLSWRVLLLPYLDEEDLYKEFKLNEAWNSPHNKKLLAKMPRVFQAPAGKKMVPFGTFYQGFAGKGAFFEGKRGLKISDITDGASNTIMVLEAAKETPWSKPEDLTFDEGKLLPKVGGIFPGHGFSAAFADGSVRYFGPKTKEATLRAYLRRNSGEPRPKDD
jgi:hypothetical protein